MHPLHAFTLNRLFMTLIHHASACSLSNWDAALEGSCLTCAWELCRAGSVCLDVINQTWSPMFGECPPAPHPDSWLVMLDHYNTCMALGELPGNCLRAGFVGADLLNVFETFLPQLLLYPNPTDPLNGEAAALLMREPEAYNAKVKGDITVTFCV